MDVYLCDFHSIRPRFEVEQSRILEWIASIHTEAQSRISNWEETSKEKEKFHREILQLLLKIGTGKEKIKKRGIHIPDIFRVSDPSIYNTTKDPRGSNHNDRTLFFARATEEILDQFYAEEIEFPRHLIHVTCTGYTAPSPAQKLIAKKAMGKTTIATNAYHMGCYASFPAMRMSSGFLSIDEGKIDVVHTELCSLHMNPLFHDLDQLIVQSLFGDGFIKYSIITNNKKKKNKQTFKLLALHEEILSETSDLMTWHTSDWGMQMGLSKEIPFVIAKHVSSFLDALLTKAKLKTPALFAIHPGGPKIIGQLAKLLHLQPNQIAHSQAILSEMGNMSSATLPHIWKSILDDQTVPLGQSVISLAFGPGLSISGALFEKGICA